MLVGSGRISMIFFQRFRIVKGKTEALFKFSHKQLNEVEVVHNETAE